MTKKNFKENTTAIDRFFSDTLETKTYNVPDAHETYDVPVAHETRNVPLPPYRINLRVRPEYKKHLEEMSWKTRKNITEYINDLIKEDISIKGTSDT